MYSNLQHRFRGYPTRPQRLVGSNCMEKLHACSQPVGLGTDTSQGLRLYPAIGRCGPSPRLPNRTDHQGVGALLTETTSNPQIGAVIPNSEVISRNSHGLSLSPSSQRQPWIQQCIHRRTAKWREFSVHPGWIPRPPDPFPSGRKEKKSGGGGGFCLPKFRRGSA